MPNKRAFITGASEGIGRSFAVKLAARGYAIQAVARNEARLKDLLAALGPGGHSSIVADLSTSAGIDRCASEVTTTHYDLVINNAGVGIYGKFTAIPLASQQAMTRLNIDAVVTISHAYLKVAQAGDALINVASGIGIMPMPAAGVYCATKAFIVALSQSLWFEQKKRGIYVMGLCPGVTATNFNVRAGGTEQEKPPAAITQTADQVVDRALKALAKRKNPIILSGFANTMLSTMGRFMTRKKVANLMGGMRELPD